MAELVADLHTHTYYSDGTVSPQELVRLATQTGLKYLAVTDHDNTMAVEECLEAASGTPLEIIPGCELSCIYNGRSMHIIGLFIDWQSEFFQTALKTLQKSREERTPKIIEKFQQHGVEITLEELQKEAGKGVVGRPHFAALLVKKGYVKTIEEAFEKYLKKGRPAYAEKYNFEPKQAIDLIHEAGGLAVLCHPIHVALNQGQTIREVLIDLKNQGLDAVEVQHSDHSFEYQSQLSGWVQELGLLESGGSDFHGANKIGVHLGQGQGNVSLSETVVLQLKRYLKK